MVILAKEERGVAVENARAMGRARGARRRREDILVLGGLKAGFVCGRFGRVIEREEVR
jgi:hypothetical protein